MRRRPFLCTASTLLVGLAGCTTPLSNHDSLANDITAMNDRDETVLADIVVALPDGETVDSIRHTLPPGTTTLEDLAEYGTYDLTVAIDGMAAKSHEWNATDCNHLTVRIRVDEVTFSEGEC